MARLGFFGVAAVCVVAAVSGGALAQTRSPETILNNLDKDGDGRISAQEAKGKPLPFDRLDADGDGYVTLTELNSGDRGGRKGGSGSEGSGAEAAMKAQDLNGDDRIALREWMNFHEGRFLKIDSDGDGYLTVEELSAGQ